VLAESKEIKSISNFGENIKILYNNGKIKALKAEAKDDEIIIETILKEVK